jgi:hypothetical protein
MHQYLLNHVTVSLTNLNVRVTSSEGKAEVIERKVGDFSWSGPSKCRLENLNDKPLEEVVVELRN